MTIEGGTFCPGIALNEVVKGGLGCATGKNRREKQANDMDWFRDNGSGKSFRVSKYLDEVTPRMEL